MHEVGFAKADTAIKEERVAAGRHGRGFRYAAGCGVGELVRLTDDEVIERITRIERRRNRIGINRLIFVGSMAQHGGFQPGGRGLLRGGIGDRDRLGLNENIDRVDRLIFLAPEAQDVFAVMRQNPLPHKAGGHGNHHLAVFNIGQFKRL